MRAGTARPVPPGGGWLASAGRRIRWRRVDTIVVGSGVAGLSAALAIGRCVVVTDAELGWGGSSPLAQGGVAAAVGPGDSPASHAEDTLAVSAGLADPGIVRLVADGGPRAIAWLLGLGAGFDLDPGGTLALGREAGHSARRIVHANGDATGAAVVATLIGAVRASAGIDVLERTSAVDLVRAGDQVAGVLIAGPGGELEVLLAGAVVLATGGYAHCFERTTTPPGVVGAGIAMAARAGAAVADMELVQFHPTALDVAGAAQLPLLTEALRGEGAILVNRFGQRYLAGEHPDAELAPRDVVARANYRQLVAGHRPYLDARLAVGQRFPARFPTVFALAGEHGFDPRVDLLPVSPAAHYCMGGVAVDRSGRASLRGLWAVGETASSGLHGANRLASNSLLEGLVMAEAVGPDAAGSAWRGDPSSLDAIWLPADLGDLDRLATEGDGADGRDTVVDELRHHLWVGAGVVRDAGGLEALLGGLGDLAGRAARCLRARTVHTVAELVASGALARTESRGAHHRSDHPLPDPDQAARRVVEPRPVTAQRWVAGEPERLAVPALAG
jgi:L-aspartate oxidase